MYIKGGGEVADPRGRAMGGFLLGLPVQVGFVPFLFPLGEGGKEEEDGRKGAPPTLVQFGLGLGGARLHLAAASSLH